LNNNKRSQNDQVHSRRKKSETDSERETRKKYSAEEKIRIVLEGLRAEDSVANICRREGINTNTYYTWSKDFMEAGKRRLAGDIIREANRDEVQHLRKEWVDLKLLYADLSLDHAV